MASLDFFQQRLSTLSVLPDSEVRHCYSALTSYGLNPDPERCTFSYLFPTISRPETLPPPHYGRYLLQTKPEYAQFFTFTMLRILDVLARENIVHNSKIDPLVIFQNHCTTMTADALLSLSSRGSKLSHVETYDPNFPWNDQGTPISLAVDSAHEINSLMHYTMSCFRSSVLLLGNLLFLTRPVNDPMDDKHINRFLTKFDTVNMVFFHPVSPFEQYIRDADHLPHARRHAVLKSRICRATLPIAPTPPFSSVDILAKCPQHPDGSLSTYDLDGKQKGKLHVHLDLPCTCDPITIGALPSQISVSDEMLEICGQGTLLPGHPESLMHASVRSLALAVVQEIKHLTPICRYWNQLFREPATPDLVINNNALADILSTVTCRACICD